MLALAGLELVAFQCRFVYPEKVTAESHQIMDSTATMNNGIKQQTLWQFAGIVIAIISLVVTLGVWFLGTKFESQDRYLESRFESQDKYLESRYDRVDEKFEGVYRHIDTRFDLESRFDHVNARIDELKPGVPDTRASAAYSLDGSTQ